MNKIIFSSILVALGLSTAFAANANAPAAQLNTGLNAAANTTTTGSPTASDYQSKTTSAISIAPRDNLIIATTTTNWDMKASDSLGIHWIAPKGGYCQDSTFNLVRGPNTSHDVSWAYRTVVHTNSKGVTITCQGHWVAEVINVNTNQVLASAGYDVAPANKPPLSGNTVLPSSDSTSAQ